jgi:hypothetical protein
MAKCGARNENNPLVKTENSASYQTAVFFVIFAVNVCPGSQVVKGKCQITNQLMFIYL